MFKNSNYIALEFTKYDNSACSGNVIRVYFSLTIAKDECSKDSKCNGIFDANCDEHLFWKCEDGIESSTENEANNSCVWKKGSKLRWTCNIP